MKKLTGNIEIELTDVDDGTVQTISETNMVTNAVNDILGMNPMGVMYKAAGNYDDLVVWNENLLPICPNMIGGILLFGSSIDEAADNLYLPSTNPPVAYASNDVNATANTRRGSLNLTESMALIDGYKFVWEFTASQGNGTIAAIGLTSKQGGANAYGSEVAVDTTLLQIRKIGLDEDDGFINDLFRTVTVDFANGKLYSLSYVSNTVTIKRYRIPVFDIGLNEKLDDSTLTLEDTTVLQCSTFKFYRVRKSWADSKTQKGAYKILDNAKKCADQNPGYKVFDADGKVVYEPKAAEPAVKVPFLVKVSISDLNIRKGPGTDYGRVQFCPVGVYTIMEVKVGQGSKAGWGRLKSGIGWISLDFCKKI